MIELKAERSKRWSRNGAGTALIVVGCIQVVGSTVAIVSAIAAAGLEVLVLMIKALFAVSGGKREIESTPGADAFIHSALNIGALGFVLAAIAVAAGILVLRSKNIAMYFVAAFVIFSYLLAYRHLLVAWYWASATYTILGSVFAALLVLAWSSRPPRLPPSSEPDRAVD